MASTLAPIIEVMAEATSMPRVSDLHPCVVRSDTPCLEDRRACDAKRFPVHSWFKRRLDNRVESFAGAVSSDGRAPDF